MVKGLLILALVLAVACDRTGDRVEASAVRVIDGDTVELAGETVRLLGYDTPETFRPGCMGEKHKGLLATNRLKELVGSGAIIRVAWTDERDRYDRRLASVTIDRRDVGAILIAEGLARSYEGGRRGSWC